MSNTKNLLMTYAFVALVALAVVKPFADRARVLISNQAVAVAVATDVEITR